MVTIAVYLFLIDLSLLKPMILVLQNTMDSFLSIFQRVTCEYKLVPSRDFIHLWAN